MTQRNVKHKALSVRALGKCEETKEVESRKLQLDILPTNPQTCTVRSCINYTPIAFDERVTFWLQRARSLPCACVFAALYACAIA